MERTIWFDMDGTFVDLYGVNDWLKQILAENPAPYKNALPLINMRVFARLIHSVQKKGYKVGIVSWGSKVYSKHYHSAITKAKKEWLKKHLPSITFDAVYVLPYGYEKHSIRTNRNDILIDDECGNREAWGVNAYPETDIFQVLKSL